MTDPIYKRTADRVRAELGTAAVLLVSFNHFGYPTLVTSTDPEKLTPEQATCLNNLSSDLLAYGSAHYPLAL